jgi:hypothetical protein
MPPSLDRMVHLRQSPGKFEFENAVFRHFERGAQCTQLHCAGDDSCKHLHRNIDVCDGMPNRLGCGCRTESREHVSRRCLLGKALARWPGVLLLRLLVDCSREHHSHEYDPGKESEPR